MGVYGVPVALIGIAYIILVSHWLLPDIKKGYSSMLALYQDSMEGILLGERVVQWSPAAGRTVHNSGLRDTGGIYLMSVHRIHWAVLHEFVLNSGKVQFSTG